MDTFGKRLKYARERKSLTVKELAELMGKSAHSTIIAWEKDKSEVTISQLKELAKILDVSEEFLLNGSDLSTVSDPPQDYILIKKDDLLKLQEQVINKQAEELKKTKEELESIKNIH